MGRNLFLALNCFIFVSIITVFSTVATAADINLNNLKNTVASEGQKDFNTISTELGRMIYLTPGTSPEPLGLIGFNVSLELGFIKIDKEPIEKATGEDISVSTVWIPKLRVQKGLLFGFDVGVALLPAIDPSGVGMFGAELKYDLLEIIPIPTPLLHISTRLSYSIMNGVDDLDMNTVGVDLSGGVNFPFLKPYVGVGMYRITSTPKNEPGLIFSEVEEDVTTIFAGLKFTLIPLVAINFEVQSGSGTSFYLRAGAEF